MPNTYACKGVFNPIFPPNSAEGLHFSAFHYYLHHTKYFILHAYPETQYCIMLSIGIYRLCNLCVLFTLKKAKAETLCFKKKSEK